jgi:hypothetical protein
VYAIDVSDNGTRVFVGGPFSTINGKDHYSLAMLNNTTGAAFAFPAAAAIPKPTATCTTRVKDIDTLGDNVYVSNGGDGGGCYDGVLAAQVSTGQLLWQNKCLGATEAIKAIGNWVYKGSHAHDCWSRAPSTATSAPGTRTPTRTRAAPPRSVRWRWPVLPRTCGSVVTSCTSTDRSSRA